MVKRVYLGVAILAGQEAVSTRLSAKPQDLPSKPAAPTCIRLVAAGWHTHTLNAPGKFLISALGTLPRSAIGGPAAEPTAWCDTSDAQDEASAPAGTPDGYDPTAPEETARKIAECDRKLAQYRAALDAGASPATVATWIAETDADPDDAILRQLGLKLTYHPGRRPVQSHGPTRGIWVFRQCPRSESPGIYTPVITGEPVIGG